jgi:hypothetical protein
MYAFWLCLIINVLLSSVIYVYFRNAEETKLIYLLCLVFVMGTAFFILEYLTDLFSLGYGKLSIYLFFFIPYLTIVIPYHFNHGYKKALDEYLLWKKQKEI